MRLINHNIGYLHELADFNALKSIRYCVTETVGGGICGV